MGALPRVNTVENCAVVDQEVDPETTLARERDQHEIVAEDFHLANALAWAARDLDVEFVARVVDIDDQAAGRLVEALREFREEAERPGPQRTPLFIVEGCRAFQLDGLDLDRVRLGGHLTKLSDPVGQFVDLQPGGCMQLL